MSIQTAGAVRAPFLLPTPRPHVRHSQKKEGEGAKTHSSSPSGCVSHNDLVGQPPCSPPLPSVMRR